MELLVHMPVSVMALMRLRVGRGEILCGFSMWVLVPEGVRVIVVVLRSCFGILRLQRCLARSKLSHSAVGALRKEGQSMGENTVWQQSMSHAVRKMCAALAKKYFNPSVSPTTRSPKGLS